MPLPADLSSLLGRVYVPDARDANFPASVHLASLAPAPTVLSRTHIRGPIRVDQGQHGYCFPAGTLIRLANKAWKPIEQLGLFQEVLTAEGHTGRIMQLMARHHSGTLVNVRLRGHNAFASTPEHPVLTRRGYVPAKALDVGRDYVALTKAAPSQAKEIDLREVLTEKEIRQAQSGQRVITARGRESTIAYVPDVLVPTPALGRLLGLYAAEGHARDNRVAWSFGWHEDTTLVEETANLIRTELKAEPVIKRLAHGSTQVTLYGVAWERVFSRLVPGTARHGDKCLSPWISDQSPEFTEALFFGWMDGDGHRRRTSSEGITVARQLAFDMWAIASDLGLRPCINVSRPSENHHAETRQDRWSITVAEGGGNNIAAQTDSEVWRKVTAIEHTPFEGFVFNMEVQGDNSYVANGLGVHNCVGYAGSNWKQCSPIRTPVTNQTGTDDYMACKQVDGLPPNGSDGTYDRALMKVYVAQGIIDRYLWATTPEELKNWILMVGPVMVGTPWYGSMFNPDAKGLVTISGTVVGGHEYLVRGWSNTAKKYRCSNSWSAHWGIDGDFWIREADLNRLVFAENGDACCAVQRLP